MCSMHICVHMCVCMCIQLLIDAERTSKEINKELVTLVPPGRGQGGRKTLDCTFGVPFRSWTMYMYCL